MSDPIEIQKVEQLTRIANALETLSVIAPALPKIADALESIGVALTYCGKSITKDGKLMVDVSGFMNFKEQQ